MLQRLFFILATLSLAVSAPLRAASFEVSASVDKTEVELGEPLRYTLTMQVNGRLDFPVQIDPPKFEGFQAQGPGRADSSSWINGAVTETHQFSWDLTPIKAGTLVLPPIKANAKDALTGEVVKSTQGFSIKVKRPKNAYNGMNQPQALPTYGIQNQAQEEPPQTPDDSGLRDIKGDRGLPWLALAGIFGAFGAVMALLVWWARRPSEEVLDVPRIKDPRTWAMMRLEKARKSFKPGKETDFAVEVHSILRDYLQQRYGLWRGATLGEALKVARRKDGVLVPSMKNLRQRLDSVVFGQAKTNEDELELIFDGSRLFIEDIEEARKGGPLLSALSEDLECLCGAPDALVAMRTRFMDYLKQAHGAAQASSMRVLLEEGLAGMETPLFVRTAELILAPGNPKQVEPHDFKDALISLARALGPVKNEGVVNHGKR